ncbi:MAG: hypothetical protein HW403_215 [Dehalococcoidia bacterium]|nr:hypothetical protein [Dehalococcoidia bacterium]
MSISRESYESGSILPRAEVLAYLQSNPERAYTIDQIYRDTRTTLEYSKEQLEELLRQLIEDRRVESKILEGVEYFRVVRRRIGFRPGGR